MKGDPTTSTFRRTPVVGAIVGETHGSGLVSDQLNKVVFITIVVVVVVDISSPFSRCHIPCLVKVSFGCEQIRFGIGPNGMSQLFSSQL